MSGSSGNPFWKLGNRGRELPRDANLSLVLENGEKGDGPFGDRCVPLWPDREWIGAANQGGGRVPAPDNWTKSGKERQDTEMGDSRRRW